MQALGGARVTGAGARAACASAQPSDNRRSRKPRMYETLESLREVRLYPVAPLCDGDLSLRLAATEPLDEAAGWVPAYRFDMYLQGVRHAVGGISLRIANTDHVVMYLGHIGYHVEPAYRGRRLAARSCRLLLPLARRHGLDPLWITCNPDNWASRRTCELVGARLVEIVDVPSDNPIYLNGEPRKCRYRLDIPDGRLAPALSASCNPESL